jgi:MtN3 and saliva related transmembrane protein
MKLFTGVEMIGTIGALVICISAIPQVIKTYITKSSGDLSIMYLSILMLGMILLQTYSISVKDFVFIFGNTLSMIMTGLLIVMWFKYRKII